ncbi:MAG: hemin uptake protein HemP [Nitrosomonas sp.]
MNTRKTLDSELLFSNGDIVFIRHKGEQYSLRRTRNGKLILNK